MNSPSPKPGPAHVTYYVDEAGDGVLFGPKGRNRLEDPDAPKFFILGMVCCAADEVVVRSLEDLRAALQKNPLYATIYSLKPEAQKTARVFHAKDDHPEIRSKVFELITTLNFKFFAVIKDMRKVLEYVQSRNLQAAAYHYHPNELYDLTVRMLFKHRFNQDDHHRVIFARRGHSDRTEALTWQLEHTRQQYLAQHQTPSSTRLEVVPAYPWEQPCVQLADYCVWAVQRCYEKHEPRFLNAIWPKVSLIHDVDDPQERRGYGKYLHRKGSPPNPEQIKNRWI